MKIVGNCLATIVLSVACSSPTPRQPSVDATLAAASDAGESCPNGVRVYEDADDDGFGDFSSIGIVVCAETPGYVNNQDDCADGDADAYPFQPGYFTEPIGGAVRANLAYDYNCNGIENLRNTRAVSECPTRLTQSSCQQGGPGWVTIVPACGANGWWITGCHWNFSTDRCTWNETMTVLPQECQ